MRKTVSVGLAVAALTLGAAACGDDDDEDGGGQATAPAPTATTPTPTATTPAEGRAPVAISATEFKFTPSNVDAKAGRVTFRLRNDGGAPHALEIEGQGVEEETKTINGGETDELTVDLKPGTYEMYCPVGNHRQMGMEGELTVS